MKDLVTIIVPYFKKKFFFKETINSILNQSYKNYEIILIYDDIDRSEIKYVKYILKKIKRKKIIINKKNLGAGMSRNIGIKASKGKFIAFIDADDLWHKNKIKNQIDFMKEKKINFSYCGYKIVNKSKKFIKKIIAPKKITFQKLLYACDIGLSTVMLKKNLLNYNCEFPSMVSKEDFVLWLKILQNGVSLKGIDKVLTIWRETENSLSSSIYQKMKDGFNVYYKHMNFNFVKSFIYLIYLSINYIKKSK